MNSPLDKQQEDRLLPVECQQGEFWRVLEERGRTLSGGFLGVADGLAAVFGLTNIPGAWQHTLATSASSCEILTANFSSRSS
jgi:hypothetical protein